MPTFEIEQYEIHAQKYRVEANNKAEAIKMLFDGEADAVDNGFDYIEVYENLGLPVEEHRELVEQLRSLGVSVGEVVMPSIRSITNLDEQNS